MALPFIVMAIIHAFWDQADNSIAFTLLYYMATIGMAQSMPL